MIPQKRLLDGRMTASEEAFNAWNQPTAPVFKIKSSDAGGLVKTKINRLSPKIVRLFGRLYGRF
ncbi:MAG: hypothetical protein DKT66_12385 [Candidatus Melainabacteria bacterium]|nr:MAG: hypothetical protein DKT66_12385 [Candidatus Melainabacteria bacterium]